MKIASVAAALAAAVACVGALSVKVAISGKTKQCEGYMTFLALDTDCGPCLYGVKDFRKATVICKSDELAKVCCKTVSSTW